MRKINLAIILVISVIFSSCATNLPMTSSLNDFVMMGIKTNSKDNITFNYKSEIADGLIKPFDKDKSKELTNHMGFNHTESTTLERMVKEYMSNRFLNISEDSNIKIDVILKDFWIEQYVTDSGGKQVMVALIGGEVNNLCVTKVKVLVNITKEDGNTLSKIITATSEDTYVQGVGTGTSTSNVYRGKNSVEYIHAGNINKANNKIIMMMNAYLEEIGL